MFWFCWKGGQARGGRQCSAAEGRGQRREVRRWERTSRECQEATGERDRERSWSDKCRPPTAWPFIFKKFNHPCSPRQTSLSGPKLGESHGVSSPEEKHDSSWASVQSNVYTHYKEYINRVFYKDCPIHMPGDFLNNSQSVNSSMEQLSL